MIEASTFEARQQSVREILRLNQLEGLLFTSLENIRYCCGFTGSDGALLIDREGTYFLTDSRYWTQAEEEVRGAKIVHYKKKLEGVASLLSDLGLKRVGVEGPSLPLSFYRALTERLGTALEMVPLEGELKDLRAIKDAQELSLIRKAIDLSTKSFLQMIQGIRDGVAERDLALEMEIFMKKNGAEGTGFDLIVASGSRSALPHGRASQKRILRGELILVDFGVRFQGYHADQTRTFVWGRPDPKQEEIFQIVKEAHDLAIEAIRPGVPFSEIDRVAREHIKRQGYGDYFGHGLGHGIGLAVHEDPVVNGENMGLIQAGMVFTVEPGIYLPNWGGVRIEDMVLVTQDGAEVLTPLPRELTMI
ncbi:MAG: Xaa-Pro peptidase family protein [Desulfobacterota bacterium]|nr:Xaa-Pro peptidase family protein [Thermodesulfobacteriota bacterium]